MFYTDQEEEQYHLLRGIQQLGETSVGMWSKPTVRRKTKIVCTIGPSTNTREMIWKLAEAGMNVARMNMSHGDHASHQKVIDLVKEYNAQSKDNVIAIMLDTKASFLFVFGLLAFYATIFNCLIGQSAWLLDCSDNSLYLVDHFLLIHNYLVYFISPLPGS